MVITPFVLALVISQDPPVKMPNLLRTIIGVPTGRNGYEEYLAAAEETATRDFQSNSKAVLEAGPGQLHWLAARKKLAQSSHSISELMALGNKKDVFEPRKTFDYDTLVPEYAYMKNVARYLPVLATAEFSEGRNVQGADSLLQGLVFSNKLSGTSTILAYLVGMACRSIILQGYFENLGRIPLSAWSPVVKECDLGLDPNIFVTVIDRDLSNTARLIGDAVQSGKSLDEILALGDLETNNVASRVSKMSAGERDQLARKVVAGIDRFRKLSKSLASAPEPTWYASMASLDQFAGTEPDPVVRTLIESSLPVYSMLFQSTLKSRVQLRLLKVHALIETFRWKTGRLPARIEELKDTAACFDPLVSAPFSYIVSGDDYSLYSTGVPALGRIELVYSRPKNMGVGPGDPVNP